MNVNEALSKAVRKFLLIHHGEKPNTKEEYEMIDSAYSSLIEKYSKRIKNKQLFEQEQSKKIGEIEKEHKKAVSEEEIRALVENEIAELEKSLKLEKSHLKELCKKIEEYNPNTLKILDDYTEKTISQINQDVEKENNHELVKKYGHLAVMHYKMENIPELKREIIRENFPIGEKENNKDNRKCARMYYKIEKTRILVKMLQEKVSNMKKNRDIIKDERRAEIEKMYQYKESYETKRKNSAIVKKIKLLKKLRDVEKEYSEFLAEYGPTFASQTEEVTTGGKKR